MSDLEIVPPVDDGGVTLIRGTGQRTLDDADRAAIGPLLRTAGALAFQGFDIDARSFAEVTSALSSDFHVDPNRDDIPGLPRHVRSITQGPAAEQLHSELSSTQFRPEVIWFYCAVPAESGGETRLCDGATLWDRLRPETQEFFRANRVIYSRRNRVVSAREAEHWAAPELAGAAKVILTRIDDDRFLLARSVSPINLGLDGRPAFANGLVTDSYEKCVAVLEDGSQIPLPFWRDASQVGLATEARIKLDAGQFVMIDNLRFMHGRTPVDPGHRRVFYAVVADKLSTAT
jgi:alpha-ketoglutarate-dependent taurine dioxygenase